MGVARAGAPTGAASALGGAPRSEQYTARPVATVLFHRNFKRFQGGHLKVFHYFEHVRSSPSHTALIRFSNDSVWDESNPWLGEREAVVGPEEQVAADVLFLAGTDWRWLEPRQRSAPPQPIVNLIQGVRHVRREELSQFLIHPAIRLCTSPEIHEALSEDGTARGPLLTVPMGLDLERLPAPHAGEERDIDCLVLAVKDPPLGRAIAGRLARAGHGVMLLDRQIPRGELLDAMARTRVAVLLPVGVEGFYLPALEAMALGALVVCPDCVGNRSFCRDAETCLVPERSERAILAAALQALGAPDDELAPLLAAAGEEARRHGLAEERSRFLEILGRVDELWEGGVG
jgi:Glycosyl transferases group 1